MWWPGKATPGELLISRRYRRKRTAAWIKLAVMNDFSTYIARLPQFHRYKMYCWKGGEIPYDCLPPCRNVPRQHIHTPTSVIRKLTFLVPDQCLALPDHWFVFRINFQAQFAIWISKSIGSRITREICRFSVGSYISTSGCMFSSVGSTPHMA